MRWHNVENKWKGKRKNIIYKTESALEAAQRKREAAENTIRLRTTREKKIKEK